MHTIDISGIPKAALLAALYNNSKPRGMGFKDPECETILSEKDAEKIIEDKGTCKFDYLNGRVMKIHFEGNELYTYLYNRDIGEGEAERVITELRGRLADELITTEEVNEGSSTAQGTQGNQLLNELKANAKASLEAYKEGGASPFHGLVGFFNPKWRRHHQGKAGAAIEYINECETAQEVVDTLHGIDKPDAMWTDDGVDPLGGYVTAVREALANALDGVKEEAAFMALVEKVSADALNQALVIRGGNGSCS